ncbi:MAG: TIGR02594 family protein, partial [Pseudomonadota bacterium]
MTTMTATAPWLDALAARVGEREIPGPEHNPIIVHWGKIAGIDWWNNDEDAWCAVAVNGVLVESGYPSTGSALARSFMKYGTRLSRVVPGSIVVFPRGRHAWQGHVGIVETLNGDGTITILDGNASNMVKRSRYKISSILPGGIRWPPGAEIPPEVRSRAVAANANDLGDRLLREGDRGADVEELQVALDRLGLMENNTELALFGPDTDEAVRAFQKTNGLKRDGIVGPATIAALTERLAARKRTEKAKADAGKAAAPATVITTGAGAAATA